MDWKHFIILFSLAAKALSQGGSRSPMQHSVFTNKKTLVTPEVIRSSTRLLKDLLNKDKVISQNLRKNSTPVSIETQQHRLYTKLKKEFKDLRDFAKQLLLNPTKINRDLMAMIKENPLDATTQSSYFTSSTEYPPFYDAVPNYI